ncbi:MAG TPA: FMN-binding protein [Nevskiaceae bacterium]|nr:FMN-binding protein [Nevskiaceae bacterium]
MNRDSTEASDRRPDAASPLASKRTFLRGALAALASAVTGSTWAEVKKFELFKTFQTPEAFLAEAFGATVPPPATLDLDGPKQSQVASVFGRPFPLSRVRYWRANGRTAWIFDDIGKTGYQPTTSGFVIAGGAVEMARVLIYRESRGEQVGERSFLQQFSGARPAGAALDRTIDNISGATYSVKMMQRMARTAIALDALVPAA